MKEEKLIKARLEDLKNQINRQKAKKAKKNVSAIIITDLIAGISVGAISGYYTDKFLKTLPIFLILFSILGFFAALLNIYRGLYKD